MKLVIEIDDIKDIDACEAAAKRLYEAIREHYSEESARLLFEQVAASSQAVRFLEDAETTAAKITEHLVLCERDFRAGDKASLFQAMVVCLTTELPFPIWKWAADAFIEACQSLPDSWDDVFGPPVPKGKQASRVRRYKSLGPPLVFYARQLMADGAPNDEHLMKRVGKKFNVSGGTARRIFDETREIAVFTWEINELARTELGANHTPAEFEAWVFQNHPRLLQNFYNFSKTPKRLISGKSVHKMGTSQKSKTN